LPVEVCAQALGERVSVSRRIESHGCNVAVDVKVHQVISHPRRLTPVDGSPPAVIVRQLCLSQARSFWVLGQGVVPSRDFSAAAPRPEFVDGRTLALDPSQWLSCVQVCDVDENEDFAA